MKLEIKNLRKHFGIHKALGTLNLDVPECQTLVLIGPSGSGKSTLLRLLAGLTYPDSGTITIDQVPITFEERALRKYRRGIGVVFQSWNLFPHLTALENIVLPLNKVQGFTLKEAEERSYDLLKRFSLDSHAHKKPYALSGGQVQRVALIRAIAAHPKLLLLDEPTSALDPLMTAEVLELILELKNEGKNIILATHHINFARRLADQAIFLYEGRLLEHGPMKDVLENPKTHLAKKYMASVIEY